MLKEDKKELAALVNAYSLKEIVQVLAEIAFERAGMMSDMELKGKAKAWSKDASLLEELSEEIKE